MQPYKIYIHLSIYVTIIHKRVYNRVTVSFTNKPILTEAQYLYYDWFRSLNKEKGLCLSYDQGRTQGGGDLG